jgi:hypothetical protein
VNELETERVVSGYAIGGAKRRERVSLLRQANVIDESRLAELLQRHGVAPS